MRATVLLCNYNYGQYIVGAIESALKQDYGDGLQICIIDDNSNDDSWQKINEFLFVGHEVKEQTLGDVFCVQRIIPDSNIKIVALKLPTTNGPSHARNIGIEATKNDTDIYFVLDADDVMFPNKVSRMIAKFKQYPHLSVVYADYDILNVDTNNIVREYKWPFSRRKLMQECIVHSGSAIKRDALLEVAENTGYYDYRLRCAEDYDLWLRISDKHIIGHIPEVLTLVRVHNNNSTNSVKKEIWNQCWQLVSHKAQQRYNGK